MLLLLLTSAISCYRSYRCLICFLCCRYGIETAHVLVLQHAASVLRRGLPITVLSNDLST
jgi:hypothetical protein